MHFREHAKKMRRRRQILRQLKSFFPNLPPGGRFKFNNTCTTGSMVQRFKEPAPGVRFGVPNQLPPAR